MMKKLDFRVRYADNFRIFQKRSARGPSEICPDFRTKHHVKWWIHRGFLQTQIWFCSGKLVGG